MMSANKLYLLKSIPDLIYDINKGYMCSKDLIEETILRVQEQEDNYKAWAFFDREILFNSAKRIADYEYGSRRHLTLKGIPFGVKDIFNTSEYPTQMGSPIWCGFTPGNNARVVDNLIDCGALVAGKTVTAEFAVHSLNKTLNPHSKIHTPGTSSSGSAVAVAAGMVPFCLATQTAGSIIRPSSFCGVWGFKPSFGLIPRTGVLKTTDSLDTIGFISSHGKSLRVILDVIRVKGPDYPYVYKNIDRSLKQENLQKQRWRVGFVKTHTWNNALDYVKDSLVSFMTVLNSENDIDIEEIIWPENLNNTHEVHDTIYKKSLSYYFQEEAKDTNEISIIMQQMIDNGNKISSAEYLDSLLAQELICAEVNSLFEPYDAVISLSTSSSAPLRNQKEIDDPALIWTMSHLPAISVPLFRCPDGLPFGLQIISRKWGDYNILSFVEELINRELIPEGSTRIMSSEGHN